MERGDYMKEIEDHVNKRKRSDSEDDNRLCSNWAPSRRCKFGERCREKSICSYYHGEESRQLAKDYCTCTSNDCPRPHPNRRQQVARSREKKPRLVCKKCGGDHLVTYCPEVQCSFCKRWDHMASVCPYK